MAEFTKRKFFTTTDEVMELPPLNNLQIDSYNWFLKEGFKELLEEISPVRDFTGKLFELSIEDYFLEEPVVDEATARERNLTYKAPMRAKIKLTNKETGEIKETEVFFGEFPLMTDQGTFIINGIERVVVAQIVRSPGVLFVSEESEGQRYFGAKIIPVRGAWLELETNKRGIIWVKIDRKRKVPVTTMLRAFGYGSDEEIRKAFAGVVKDPAYDFIEKTLERDPAKSFETGMVEVYKKIRPGDLATVENAKQLIQAMFFDFRRYDLGRVGRYKLNQRLGLSLPINRKTRVLQPSDLVEIVKEIINLSQTGGTPDDIDHLGNRRVRAVGELLQSKIRVGLLRMERIIKDRMSVSDPASVTPAQLINVHPLTAALQEFFASSQLSQFMDQTNPLSELEHKRRISAMGPGGLSRERASFEVRDVHSSHYGRICPIETPEGPNVGLVGDLATYARVNQYGFIETPYRVVKHKNGKSYATKEVVYLDANEEQKAVIAQAGIPLSKSGEILEKRVEARVFGEPEIVSVDKVEYMDVSPVQTVAVATGLIPFMEHDEAVRASMGANMLRQAVPLVRPEAPIVGTGLEARAAIDSGNIIIAKDAGVVTAVSAQHIKVMERSGKERTYHLKNFVRSNQALAIHQRPVVEKGQKVAKGELLADALSTDNGELALGQNVLVAFMPWNGGNFEDAVLISERLVEQDRYTSIHIDNFRVEVRDTKLGPEVVTRDIPNVGEEALKNLDEEGIIRIGASVSSGDILVGKITPKGETELTAEEKLLRAIFGEKARDVKDTSLRLPHGEYGKVIDIKIFSRELGDELPAGVLSAIEVSVAQLRKITVGDKMAGRHGNKGVISKVVPVEDMPYMKDGTPIDIILNPLGIISRMNIGQVLETHLGWAAKALGYKVASPVFQGVPIETITAEMKKANLPENGKVELYDGKTGKKFENPVCVGVIYMMKLIHLVEDKIHARSTGPYATITQQPLGGKAQFGGQRFGEMEVWALQAYGAANSLQEMLTIKSDDVLGRSKAYESIIKNEEIKKPATPESFNVLTRELQSLGLRVDLLKKVSEKKIKKVELPSVAEKEEEMRGTVVVSADEIAEEVAERASEKKVVKIEEEREDVDEVDVGVEEP
jgi:DNA-directed RNA polymerase subunit beta